MRDERINKGRLLEILRADYPDWVDEEVLIYSWPVMIAPKEARELLAYLVDKGYVEVKEVPHPRYYRVKIRIYRLSPKGFELFEGVVRDPAIILPGEA